jgi:hypothetical protein
MQQAALNPQGIREVRSFFHKSGVQESTNVSLSAPPAGPFETHLALPNRVLVGGACITQPLFRPGGLSCAAILLCDLSPLAASCAHFPPDFVSRQGPSRVISQGPFFNTKTLLTCLSQLKVDAILSSHKNKNASSLVF